MYSGYILFCSNTSLEQCLRRRVYTCADKKTMPTEKVKAGSVIFLYNIDDDSLLGPFTALSEGGRALETGAWAMDVDMHSASENIRVEWEELHRLEKAAGQLPIVKSPKACVLSTTQTQRALDLLKQAPVYIQQT